MHIVRYTEFDAAIFLNLQYTAKPAERQKKLIILGDGLAKQSETQQCKFQFKSLLVPLTSISSAVQASVV